MAEYIYTILIFILLVLVLPFSMESMANFILKRKLKDKILLSLVNTLIFIITFLLTGRLFFRFSGRHNYNLEIGFVNFLILFSSIKFGFIINSFLKDKLRNKFTVIILDAFIFLIILSAQRFFVFYELRRGGYMSKLSSENYELGQQFNPEDFSYNATTEANRKIYLEKYK